MINYENYVQASQTAWNNLQDEFLHETTREHVVTPEVKTLIEHLVVNVLNDVEEELFEGVFHDDETG